MAEKFLCLLATFDEETSKTMEEIEDVLKRAGFVDQQTPNLPQHITLASFNTSQEEEIKKLLEDVSTNTHSFNLNFSHIGLFGLRVLFLAPDVNYELLDLHKQFENYRIKSSRGWTAHATVLIEEEENIQKALPLVVKNFKQIKGRVEGLSLYEFFPTRLIGEYKLK